MLPKSAEEEVCNPSTNQPDDLLNTWWPVAFAKNLDGDKPLGVQLFGEPLVLYKDANGEVVCAQDRCIHKSCPLSLGTIDKESQRLVCRYHGWEFGAEGALERVPTLREGDNLPGGGSPRVPTYPAMIEDDLVWVFPGPDSAVAAGARPPEATCNRSFNGERTAEDFAIAYQEVELEDTPFGLAVDINVDFSHLRYVHHNTPPGRAPPIEGGLRNFDTDMDSIVGAFCAEFLGSTGRGGGRVTFVPPCTVMTETFFEKPEFKPFPLVLVFRFVPTSPTRTKVLLKIYRDFLHQAPEWIVKDVVMNMPKVIEQDRLIMAGQLLRLRQGSPHTWMPVEADRHLLHFRNWLRCAEPEGGVWFDGFKGRGVRRMRTQDVPEPDTSRIGERDLRAELEISEQIWGGGESAGLASLAAMGPQRAKAFVDDLRPRLSKAIAKAMGEETEPPIDMH